MGDRVSTGSGFGWALRAVRAKKNMTQTKLAERSGLTASAVAKLEQGTREPSWPTVLILANALRVEVTEFLPVAQAIRKRRAEEASTTSAELIREIIANPQWRANWLVLADWLADAGEKAEVHCRQVAVVIELDNAKPSRDRPNFERNPRRDRRRRRLADSWAAWDRQVLAKLMRYGIEPANAMDLVADACGLSPKDPLRADLEAARQKLPNERTLPTR